MYYEVLDKFLHGVLDAPYNEVLDVIFGKVLGAVLDEVLDVVLNEVSWDPRCSPGGSLWGPAENPCVCVNDYLFHVC